MSQRRARDLTMAVIGALTGMVAGNFAKQGMLVEAVGMLAVGVTTMFLAWKAFRYWYGYWGCVVLSAGARPEQLYLTSNNTWVKRPDMAHVFTLSQLMRLKVVAVHWRIKPTYVRQAFYQRGQVTIEGKLTNIAHVW